MGWLGDVLLVLPEVDDESGEDGEEQNNCYCAGVAELFHEVEDLHAVAASEEGEDGVSGGAAQGQCGEELRGGILERASHEQKWSYGDGRRQHCRNGDGKESPAFESFVESLNFVVRKLFLDSFLAAGASDAVSEKSAEERTDRGHEGVVEPEILLLGGQENGGDIHSAGNRDGGVVEKAERDEADSAKAE